MERPLLNSAGFVFCAVVATTLLAGCGGGGGGVGGGNPLPSVGPTVTPSTTTRQGTVIDDASGAPLAGVTVRLDPWTSYPTPGPTPTPIVTTTTDSNGHFVLTNIPNGHYMLVIGADAVNTPPPGWSTPAPNATDTPIPGAATFQATIHDQITVGGGGSTSAPLPLTAPTMPPQSYYTPPATETNGSYRLMHLDARTQAPCILAYNQKRLSLGLPAAVADEWLLENTRAVAAADYNASAAGTSGTIQFLTGGTGSGQISGGSNCAQSDGALTFGGQSQALNPQALWYGGIYNPYNGGSVSAFGATEFIVDPRFPDTVDPGPIPMWP